MILTIVIHAKSPLIREKSCVDLANLIHILTCYNM